MKKALTPILAILAVAAIVFCFILNGQKGDLQKKIDTLQSDASALFTQEDVDTKITAAVDAAKAEASTALEEAVTKAKEGLFDQAAVDDAVAKAKEGLFDQAAVDEAVAKAKEGLFSADDVTAKITEAVDAAKTEASTALEDAVAKAKEGLFDQAAVDEAIAKAKEGLFSADDVTAKVTEAVDAAKTEAATALEDAVAKAKEGLFSEEDVTAKVTEAVDAAKTEAAKAADEAAKAAEDVKAGLEGKIAELEGKIADLEKAAAEKVEEIKEAVEEKVEEVTGAATEAVDNVTEAVEEKAAEVTEAAAETVAEVAEAVEAPAEPAAVEEPVKEPAAEEPAAEEPAAEEAKVLTYAEFAAAELDTEVCIEAYVQDHQSWWSDKITVYLQDQDGAYFAYEMACSEEDAAKLVPGTKIRVKGYKSAWSGEVEIIDCSFEFVEAEPWIAEAKDVTALFGTDALIDEMNKLVTIKDAVIVDYKDTGAAFASKNPDKRDDLYFQAKIGEGVYDFCVESYLRGGDTDVYKTVEGLQIGDTVDIDAYLYWYEGPNAHVIGVTVK
ncbi:MAG: hypothetical protein IKH18_08495 [Clostridia bacterium]|nr:hypothetical protein [Clostridia bacterium]